jgi:head-tail adaptor
MRAGIFRHRVLLQSAVDTVDDSTGEPARTWADLGYWHCEIAPISVREGLIDGGVRDEADTWLRGQYAPEVASMLAKDRAVSEAGTFYNFAGIPQIDNERRKISIRVKSGLNDG